MNLEKQAHASTHHKHLRIDLEQKYPSVCLATVIIPKEIVSMIYKEASLSQRCQAEAHGFQKGNVPILYIEENFKINLTDHLKEFLFKYFVVDFLYKTLQEQKILIAGEPRLVSIDVKPHADACFQFELSLFKSIQIQDWKYLPFKAPTRKNYKDLDRQADSFIREEKEYLKEYENTSINIGDWVNFNVQLVSSDDAGEFGEYKTNLWIKMGHEEADSPWHELFLKQTKNTAIDTNNKGIQDYFSHQIDMHYTFRIEIIDILKHGYFCFDSFKKHFKLKTNKELYQKLIEVYSYRNDLSQRRAMAQESLTLLLSKHPFSIPNHVVLRQQKTILQAVKNKPDYHVYRTQKDFADRVRQLAEKQVRETVFLDAFAYHENLAATHDDVKSYLNLTNRPRMKDFIYFDTPETKVLGQENPMPTEELKRYCLREKALNHIIYHLTKK